MRTRLLVIIAVGAVAAAILMRDLGRREPPPVPPARARAPRLVRSTGAPPFPISRNVFEYGTRPMPEATPRPAMPAVSLEPLPMAAPPPEPAVRLVGMVRRAGVTKAVLKVRGETVEVAAGETAGGYRVVGIDDDGVRLQAADGTVVTLSAGGS